MKWDAWHFRSMRLKLPTENEVAMLEMHEKQEGTRSTTGAEGAGVTVAAMAEGGYGNEVLKTPTGI